MKKIFNIMLIVIFSMTSTVFGMNTAITLAKYGISGLCSGAEALVTISPIFDNMCRSQLEREKPVIQSNAPKIITDFITTLAHEREINDIKVIVNDTHPGYSNNSITNTISIPTKEITHLEYLLSNSNRSHEEEDDLNLHIATIHHELTHNKLNSSEYTTRHDAIMGTVFGVTTSSLASQITKKHLPIVYNQFVLRNGFKIARAFLTLNVCAYVAKKHTFSKYDELRADDGIPNKKKLLQAAANKFWTDHQENLQYIEDVVKPKSWKEVFERPKKDKAKISDLQMSAMKLLPTHWLNNPLLMDIVFNARFDHPSDVRRALRLERRISELENQE